MTALGLLAGSAVIAATEAVRRRSQIRRWLVTRTRSGRKTAGGRNP
jgi:hypothetical protein